MGNWKPTFVKPIWMQDDAWAQFVKDKYGTSELGNHETNVVKYWNLNPTKMSEYGIPMPEPPFEVYDDDIEYDDPEPAYYPGGDYVERTLVMLKPDSYERNLMGEIIDILDRKELKLIGAKQFTMDANMVKKHYKNHVGKGFFPDLVDFMTSGPVFALVYEGTKACAVIRQLIGEKHPHNSPPGSIRGKYASEYPRNLVHGSDNYEEADYEIKLYFDESELFGSYYKQNQKKIQAEAELKKQQEKENILLKPLLPGQVIQYPEQVVIGSTIKSPTGQTYRVLDLKKKPKNMWHVTICGTQYVDDPHYQEDYKITLHHDDVSMAMDQWKLLTNP